MGLLITFSVICLFLVGVGTFIWKREATWLLANFPKDDTKIRDKKGLAKWTGMFLYLVAILFALLGFLINELVDTKYSMLPMIIFIPVTSLLVTLFIIGGQRFLFKN